MKTTTSVCPSCNSTIVTYDPPLTFDAEEMCGYEETFFVASEKRFITTYTERCVELKDHDGGHSYLIEELIHHE